MLLPLTLAGTLYFICIFVDIRVHIPLPLSPSPIKDFNLQTNAAAEGVETEEQIKFLTELNCDEAQCYLPPMSSPNC